MKKSFWEILKIPGIIVGCIITIISAYKYFESIPKRAETYNKALVEEVKATVKTYSDSTTAHFNRIDMRLQDNGEKLDGVIRSQAVLKNLVTKEFAKTMTPQQVLEMMENFDIKKNGSYFNGIPSEEQCETQYITRLDHE